jgi:hypothetical protein
LDYWDLGFGFWVLGYWVLGYWILDYWDLGIGFWFGVKMEDSGFQVHGLGCVVCVLG